MTRAEAKAKGLVKYFTGEPCHNGHVAERYAGDGACKQCLLERNQARRCTRPGRMKQMMATAAWRARKKGLDFDVTLEDLGVLPDYCPALGIKLDYGPGQRHTMALDRASLDRVDNARGYVPGNVRVISWKANQIKNVATAEELRSVADYIDLHQLL